MKKRKKQKYVFEKTIIVFFLVILVIFILFNRKTVDTENNYHVEINENVVLKEYTKNKREINSINYDDYKELNLTKRRIEDILDYKEYMGQINTVDELDNVPRLTKKDIDKLKRVFFDTRLKKYRKHKINSMTKKELKYIGFTEYESKKILIYRRKQNIKNIIELEKIVGNINNIKNIEF